MSNLPSILEAEARFLAFVNSQYAPYTTGAYHQAIANFQRFLLAETQLSDTSLVSELGAEHYTSYFDYLQRTYAIETEHLYSRAVRNFFEYRQRMGWGRPITEVDAYIRQHRRTKDHSLPEVPADAIRTILDYVHAAPTPTAARDDHYRSDLREMRDKAFILLLAETGLKVSEITELRVKHITEDTLSWQNQRTLLSTETSKALQHYLRARAKLDAQQPLPPSDLALFARHDRRAGSKILALSRWTGNNILNHWAEAALGIEEAKTVSFSPQILRHYYVLQAVREADSLTDAQRRARHADTSTTRRYARAISQNEEEADDAAPSDA